MAEGEHALPVDVRQGADADQVHVARGERGPDGAARQEGQRRRRRRGAAAGRRLQTVRLEDRRVVPQDAGIASRADERDADRLKPARGTPAGRQGRSLRTGPLRTAGRTGDRTVPARAGRDESTEQVGSLGSAVGGARRPRDLDHVGDRRDAGDRLLGEISEPVRHGTDELPVDIHGTAAHPRDDPGVLDLVAA